MPFPDLMLFGFRTCSVSRKCPCSGRRSCFSQVALSYLRVLVTGKVLSLAGSSSSPLGQCSHLFFLLVNPFPLLYGQTEKGRGEISLLGPSGSAVWSGDSPV